MFADKAETLSRVSSHYGMRVPKVKIDQAILAVDGDQGGTRFNKGRAGRGAETFSADQQDRVRALTRFYLSIDFSPIGL